MTREQRLTMADTASQRAADLARKAQGVAERSGQAADLAAAGVLWTLVAQTHTGIASLLPSTEETD
jgi:diacylglycerol kinase